MIEERALVLETNLDSSEFTKKIARVKVQRTSSCESCSLKSGCGQSALTKMSSKQCLELDVENTLGAKCGDEVVIAIPESGLMIASYRVYLTPLLLMVLGALIGDRVDMSVDVSSEFWTMVLALSGLVLGFYWARKFSQEKSFHEDFLPKMITILIQQA